MIAIMRGIELPTLRLDPVSPHREPGGELRYTTRPDVVSAADEDAMENAVATPASLLPRASRVRARHRAYKQGQTHERVQQHEAEYPRGASFMTTPVACRSSRPSTGCRWPSLPESTGTDPAGDLYRRRRYVSWANVEAIAALYATAALLTRTTGRSHFVDHIVPLKGRKVSGLHVENNLRIIERSENARKSNKWEYGA
jgi:hypothetical protein